LELRGERPDARVLQAQQHQAEVLAGYEHPPVDEAHVLRDHMDAASLSQLANAGKRAPAALSALERWHLVQEPVEGRYTLHAVVRHAVRKRSHFDAARFYRHYVGMLERRPERLLLEQTHLFAAMDHAHRTGDLQAMLRVEELLRRIDR